jgi:uncharacterized protein YecE (DUF72 family)
MNALTHYYLGCPVFASPGWRGTLYRTKAPRDQWLNQYSQAFNTVEGNSSFYGLPTHDTVSRWCDQTVDGFRFALKFPRDISHDRRLVGAERETDAFLDVLSVLQQRDRLGLSFLQLPPDFCGRELANLANYLKALPQSFPFAVEVRNVDFFDRGAIECEFDGVLQELKIEKVIFDSRCLYSAPPTDEYERESQARKPKTPIRYSAFGSNPMLRLIGRNDVESVRPWIRQWAPIVAAWIYAGKTPYIFAHTPNDEHAPAMAKIFHEELSRQAGMVPPLPTWLGVAEQQVADSQKQLF